MRKEGVIGLLKFLKPAFIALGVLIFLMLIGGTVMMTVVLAVIVFVMMLAQYTHWKVKHSIMELAQAGSSVEDLTEVQREHLEGLATVKSHFDNWTLQKEYIWSSVIRFTVIGVCFYYI